MGSVFTSYSEIAIVEGGQGIKRRSHNGVVGRLAEVAGRSKQHNWAGNNSWVSHGVCCRLTAILHIVIIRLERHAS